VSSYLTVSPLPAFAGGIVSVPLSFLTPRGASILPCDRTSCPLESGLSSCAEAQATATSSGVFILYQNFYFFKIYAKEMRIISHTVSHILEMIDTMTERWEGRKNPKR